MFVIMIHDAADGESRIFEGSLAVANDGLEFENGAKAINSKR